jgi:hypothetical protein
MMTDAAVWGIADGPERDLTTELDRLAASLVALSQAFRKDEKSQGGKMRRERRQRGINGECCVGGRRPRRLRPSEGEGG